MTTAIYIFAAIGCMSVGACIGLLAGTMCSMAADQERNHEI